MIYVDDLLFVGVQSIINALFSRMQNEVLQRHTGDLTAGSTIPFLGRNISHKGDYIDISLNNNYVDIILEESEMTTCNPAPSPGVPHMKGAAEDEAPLDHEQRKQYRRLVGKIQWLAYTRPDISYGSKELARSLQASTQLDNKKLKRMIRNLKGTRYMRHNLRPKMQTQDKRILLNIDTHTQMPTGDHARQQGKAQQGLYCTLLEQQHTMAAEHKQQKHFHQQNQNCTQLVQQHRRASTSATLSRKPLKYAPTSGYTQTAAQQNR